MGILKHNHLHLISYVEIPDFYVLGWNTGFSVIFIQLWLSHRITVVSFSKSKRPNISFRSHVAAQLAEQASIYSTSAVLRETLDCFLLNHELIEDPKQKHLPDVLFLPKILPAQSASV